MATDFVENKVREIIADQLGVAEDEVSLDASFTSDLGADTLDFIELILALEEEFECEIDDSEAEQFNTVSDIVSYLTQRAQ